jgi:hypothetical protein
MMTAADPGESNARHQARLKAGAQRTLEAVACMLLFGVARWHEH